MAKSYAEKLKDPRWQKRRLEVLERAEWSCEHCGRGERTLHVHHGSYLRGMDPWDYPDDMLHCLCEVCHENVGKLQDQLAQIIGRMSLLQLSAACVVFARMQDKGAVS